MSIESPEVSLLWSVADDPAHALIESAHEHHVGVDDFDHLDVTVATFDVASPSVTS